MSYYLDFSPAIKQSIVQSIFSVGFTGNSQAWEKVDVPLGSFLPARRNYKLAFGEAYRDHGRRKGQ